VDDLLEHQYLKSEGRTRVFNVSLFGNCPKVYQEPAGLATRTAEVIFVKNPLYLSLGLALIGILLFAGCAQQAPQPQPTAPPTTLPQTPVPAADTVRLMDTSLGKVLTDAEGLTLYFFVTDLAGEGTSTCYGRCAELWPIFSVENVLVSPPLRASDFSSITRTDGSKETTYRGWPLYSWWNDTKPGDVLGEGIGKVWYVAKPDYTLMVASRPKTGSYLTDGSGRALYIFTRDTPGASTCTGSCLAAWPAFSVDTVTAPSLVKASDFSSITRTDGSKQLAYKNRPLYYYASDRDGGDLLGDGVNNVWFAANVTGVVPAPTTVTTVTTIPTTTRSYYGGGGGY
jgi:predicted lipoprotein with Yx(FWY)xxD motif